MQWELLSTTDFHQAVKETGVCILPMGVLESHSTHLPLGTDYINAHYIATAAAELESAVVFPGFYFGQVYEGSHMAGTFTIKPTLLVELLLSVLDEIGRNGFQKIVLLNGHGGNSHLIGYLVQSALWEEKDYTLYSYSPFFDRELTEKWDEILAPELGGHAGASETSMDLVTLTDAVKMDQAPSYNAAPLTRLSHIGGTFTAVNWYADYPDQYQGLASGASKEIGEQMMEMAVTKMADVIRRIKDDEIAPALQAEFFQRKRTVFD